MYDGILNKTNYILVAGVLLRKLEGGLRGVSHLIVDEIHERDVNSDFLLVVLRDMVHNYPDLRVILMSATIDTTLFSEYFNKCKVLEIPGRSFPVKSKFSNLFLFLYEIVYDLKDVWLNIFILLLVILLFISVLSILINYRAL